MADNVAITAGSGTTIAADEVTDGTLGTVKVQYVKLMDGTLDGTTKAAVGANGIAVDLAAAATSVAKAEDAASASGDVGIPAMAVQKATPANTAGTDGDYENLQVSGGHLWVATPTTATVSSNFNRPADTTAYAANDAVADNTTAGSVTPLSWSISRSAGTLRRCRIKIGATGNTPTMRLHLFSSSPTVGAGDNAAFTAPYANKIGEVDVAVTSVGSDVAVGFANIDIPCTGATIYGLLQTLSAYTPASGTTYTADFWYLPG